MSPPSCAPDLEKLCKNNGKSISNPTPRRVLTLVRALDAKAFHPTQSGNFWRVYLFVEGARTYDAVENPRQAFEAVRAFGLFQQALVDLPGERLHETIPHFHDTPKRFEALRLAAVADVAGRKKEVLAELDFAFQRETEAGRLLERVRLGEIPERITHNDTKLNNVMLDDQTGDGICVIDLDTVMPGLSLYDFGDLVRFGTNTAAEDEWDNLVFAGKLMTYEVGIRFLTDYLQGDQYFKIKHPAHNLDRARNQLALVARIETAHNDLSAIVSKFKNKH